MNGQGTRSWHKPKRGKANQDDPGEDWYGETHKQPARWHGRRFDASKHDLSVPPVPARVRLITAHAPPSPSVADVDLQVRAGHLHRTSKRKHARLPTSGFAVRHGTTPLSPEARA